MGITDGSDWVRMLERVVDELWGRERGKDEAGEGGEEGNENDGAGDDGKCECDE
jgi:hypothetical protein